MSLRTITEHEMKASGVASLPTRPTSPREFGGRGFTAQELKAAFDRLPRLVAERYNELVSHILDGSYLNELPYEAGVTLRQHIDDLTARLASEEESNAEQEGILPAHGTVLERHEAQVEMLSERMNDAEAGLLLIRELLLGNIFAEATVEDAYLVRMTAGGLSIADGVTTRVLCIQGDTVAEEDSLRHASFSGISVTGKNLISRDKLNAFFDFGLSTQLNEDGSLALSGTNTSSGQISLIQSPSITIPAGRYSFRCLFSPQMGNYNHFEVLVHLGERTVYEYDLKTVNFTVSEPTTFSLTLRLKKTGLNCDGYIIHPTLVFGTTTLTEGIPSTSDTSFALSAPVSLGKWDYIDAGRGRLVRQTGSVTFNGTESGWSEVTTGSGHIKMNYPLPDFAVSEASSDAVSPFVTTHYPRISDGAAWNGENGASVSPLGNYGVVDTNCPTLAEWKNHLAALAEAGTPLTVVYKKATATEEDIPLPAGYTAWRDGLERVLTDETSPSDVLPTITQSYYIMMGGEGA